MNKQVMNRAADNIRILAAAMVEKARSGHPGGAMGGADFTNVLYSSELIFDPDDPFWPGRDRLFLDPGHMSPMLYGALTLCGFYSLEELGQFRQWGSITPGHPELDLAHGVENTSGPLGQGHAMAVGAAIAERFIAARFGESLAHKTYAFISDGGIQEEIAQGAGRIAGFLGLSNLIMFYDCNGVQLSTDVDEVDTEDYAAKYRAWGWDVLDIDGNDPEAIANALHQAQQATERPTLIIGRTIMGKGCVTADGANFEGKCSTHGQPLSKSGADVAATIRNLGGDPKAPMQIFPEVAELYAARREQLRQIVAERRAAYRSWREANPELAAELDRWLSGHLAEINTAEITVKPGSATRTASSAVLSFLAKAQPNMIVSSADLANSDKTDGFIKGGSHALLPHDFSGGFLHAGVCELTMAAIMNGIMLHGGCQAACGTFFVFSDYMKPAIRMAALMHLPVKYVFTHDSFRVGEDGPTHEPIEHEAQLRLLEQICTADGRPSMLVLRPADSAETLVAWDMALHNDAGPTALILTRQDVADLSSASGNRNADAQQARRGGYVVREAADAAITLVANGSEVGLLMAVADRLAADGISARVVSVPSVGLFNQQADSYRATVLPAGQKQFGLTAGLPVTLQMIRGFHGTIYGMSRFGASAPFKVLDEKFGYTVDNILQQVRANL